MKDAGTGPHWRDGTPVTPAEFAEWVGTPLASGEPKFLDMYLDCEVCGHIRYQVVLEFRRWSWWVGLRNKLAHLQALFFLCTHWRCEQCTFNRKVRGL